MKQDKLDKFAEKTLQYSYALGAITLITIIGYQIYQWARNAIWPSLPFSSAFDFLNIDLLYIYNPTDWRGLANICVWLLNLPLSICLPALIIFICFVIKAIINAEPE